MKRIFALVVLLATAFAAQAQVWTNLPAEKQAKATTNQVVEVNPPLASRQLFFMRFYSEADADEKTVRVRDAILWRRLMEANAAAAEAIANDRESR